MRTFGDEGRLNLKTRGLEIDVLGLLLWRELEIPLHAGNQPVPRGLISNNNIETNSAGKWSPTGKARGTSIEIPSYAKASEGYPPVAKSTEASSFKHMNHLTIFL
ncbi:MAG: hypothetical protein ACXU9L_11455, partial [Thermodesulfobacteriota bacterium]